MHFYLLISLVLFCMGNVLIILGYQIPVPENSKTPEYLYDILAIGQALFMTAPFTMIIGLCKKYTNYLLSFARIPTALGSFFVVFNMCKEVSGLNNDYSTTQLIVFLIGMTLTITIQYEYHRKHIGE